MSKIRIFKDNTLVIFAALPSKKRTFQKPHKPYV